MTFEEDFPSFTLPEEVYPEGSGMGGEGTMTVQLVKQIIQEHCLDKQRVKESLERLEKKKIEEGWTYEDSIVSADELLQELEL